MPINNMHQRLAFGVERGVKADRSYGGCAGQVKLNAEEEPGNEFGDGLLLGDRQMAYGGRGGSRKGGEKDKFGDRTFYCSNGHKNFRPKNELIPKCQHKGCAAKVACK